MEKETCSNCGGIKWLWLAEKEGKPEMVRCAACGFERERTQTDYDEFEAALEAAHIKRTQEKAALN